MHKKIRIQEYTGYILEAKQNPSLNKNSLLSHEHTLWIEAMQGDGRMMN
jgi:hypothetical protein